MNIMKQGLGLALSAVLVLPFVASNVDAQAPAAQGTENAQGMKGASNYGKAAGEIEGELKRAVAELNALRETIASEKIPLSRSLSELEGQLTAARAEFQDTKRLLDSRSLDLSNLQGEIKKRRDESSYLGNLLGEYIRNFESRLHIAELQRYEGAIQTAKLAPETEGLSPEAAFAQQAALLTVSIDRLEEALGGTRFEGQAVDASGLVNEGMFVILGPTALFKSSRGGDAAMAEQRIGSLEPSAIAFGTPEDAAAANELFASGKGSFPLDPTLGNALKMEGTHETFIEHVKKGGAVMWPIFIMAALATLFAVYKWLSMAFIGRPSEKRLAGFLEAVGNKDEESVKRHVAMIRGPVGEMLTKGVSIIDEPRELVEETMYETVLTTRLKLQGFLPFIAICAASAPLLGLLGTVTGIINTFKMITVFGSGDVKSLSGGISEALITTKFGLIVAIPSLLLHAFLSRKAKRIVDQMEKTAVSFTNELGRAHYGDAVTARQPRSLRKVVLHDKPKAAPVDGWPPVDQNELEARVEELAAEQKRLYAMIEKGFNDLSVKAN